MRCNILSVSPLNSVSSYMDSREYRLVTQSTVPFAVNIRQNIKNTLFTNIKGKKKPVITHRFYSDNLWSQHSNHLAYCNGAILNTAWPRDRSFQLASNSSWWMSIHA